ncbi:MAG: TauD/TfdA family dioxygenase [Pseudomonadota bacterium]
MRIEPITPHMGADVYDVDLNILNDELVTALRQAFLEHQVLAFREQDLSVEAHKALGRCFGDLHIHPSKKDLDTRSDPELFIINTRPESRWTNGERWHSDVSCEPVPPKASILYVREMPGSSGGDTLFANMYDAFSALSEDMQTWLRTLSAVHDGLKDLAAYNVKLKLGQTYPKAEHPVVITHSDTGREVLFINRSFTDHIVGLTRAESDAVLEMLWQHAEDNPRFHARVRYAPGTLVMWDNRCVWHHAIWDYYPQNRYAERVTICGDVAPAWVAASA